MIKKGDTLIEVTLAIGIFSMIAIAVVSVVNSSASGAQSALETTLAREEIDIQAEALRFIHSSYAANHDLDNPDSDKYTDLWQAVTEKALDKDTVTEDILGYRPSTCAELYGGTNLADQGAFIVNTKQFTSSDVDETVIHADPTSSSTKFFQASTYPRIIYEGSSEDESILDQGIGTRADRIEGIYVIAVKDMDSTQIIPSGADVAEGMAAYYDFYIRTCWYAPGAKRPSTISTIIRLYNPDIISFE